MIAVSTYSSKSSGKYMLYETYLYYWCFYYDMKETLVSKHVFLCLIWPRKLNNRPHPQFLILRSQTLRRFQCWQHNEWLYYGGHALKEFYSNTHNLIFHNFFEHLTLQLEDYTFNVYVQVKSTSYATSGVMNNFLRRILEMKFIRDMRYLMVVFN